MWMKWALGLIFLVLTLSAVSRGMDGDPVKIEYLADYLRRERGGAGDGDGPAREMPESAGTAEVSGMSRTNLTFLLHYANGNQAVFRIGPGAKNEVLGATILDALYSEIQAPRTRLYALSRQALGAAETDLGGRRLPRRWMTNRTGSLQAWEGQPMARASVRARILADFNAAARGGTQTERPRSNCSSSTSLARVPISLQLAFFVAGNIDVTENNIVWLDGDECRAKIFDFEHLRTPVRWLLDDFPWVAWGRYHPAPNWGRGQFPRDGVRQFNVTHAVMEHKSGSAEALRSQPSSIFFANLSRALEDEHPWLAISGEKLQYLWRQRHRAPIIHYVLWKRSVWVRWPLSLSAAKAREAANQRAPDGLTRSYLVSPYINTRHWGLEPGGPHFYAPSPALLMALNRLVFQPRFQEATFARLQSISESYSMDHFNALLNRCQQIISRSMALAEPI